VDPDNRRPVDYRRRREALDALLSHGDDRPLELAASLLAARADGRVKLFTTTRALAFRTQQRTLFDEGAYVPLDVAGPGASSLFAFARVRSGGVSITCVPRLVVSLPGDPTEPPLGDASWGQTTIELPPDLAHVRLTNVFTGETLAPATTGAAHLRAADVFAHFPVALLTA
jgi:(1->4)-alpha-D-glucan 1-alpha-D-glucosylmutase